MATAALRCVPSASFGMLACLVLFFSLSVMASGCAHKEATRGVSLYFASKRIADKAEESRVRQLMEDINARRESQKKSVSWLKESYAGLKIKRLNDIRPEDYRTYEKLLDSKDRRAYIIVHPAFYAFFMNARILSSRNDLIVPPSKNIVERLYEQDDASSVFDRSLDVMQEQEMALRDFMETTSTEKKLVIIVLPKDYRKYLSYGYIEGLDEYVRYINEITNMSDSVVYMESASYHVGNLTEEDAKTLAAFLKAIDSQTVMIGGGFVGRCLEGFYGSLTKEFDKDRIYVMREVSALSADDLTEAKADNLITKTGRLNFSEIVRILRYDEAYQFLGSTTKNRRLYIYAVDGSDFKLLNKQPRKKKKS